MLVLSVCDYQAGSKRTSVTGTPTHTKFKHFFFFSATWLNVYLYFFINPFLNIKYIKCHHILPLIFTFSIWNDGLVNSECMFPNTDSLNAYFKWNKKLLWNSKKRWQAKLLNFVNFFQSWAQGYLFTRSCEIIVNEHSKEGVINRVSAFSPESIWVGCHQGFCPCVCLCG